MFAAFVFPAFARKFLALLLLFTDWRFILFPQRWCVEFCLQCCKLLFRFDAQLFDVHVFLRVACAFQCCSFDVDRVVQHLLFFACEFDFHFISFCSLRYCSVCILLLMCIVVNTVCRIVYSMFFYFSYPTYLFCC